MARGAEAHSGDGTAAQGEEGRGREGEGLAQGLEGTWGGGANEIDQLAEDSSSSS